MFVGRSVWRRFARLAMDDQWIQLDHLFVGVERGHDSLPGDVQGEGGDGGERGAGVHGEGGRIESVLISL